MIVIDQLNRPVQLSNAPTRIVSLVPSLTEFLSDIDLDEEVVGLTKFCIQPNHWWKNKTRVGGTKKVNLEIIKDLKPDLIIANKEENTQSDIEYLQNLCPVYVSDILNFDDAFQAMQAIGKLCHREQKADHIVNLSKQTAKSIQRPASKMSCIYVIWHLPTMLSGQKTYINSILNHLGLKNVAVQFEGRYPAIDENISTHSKIDYVLLSSEPFPFKEKHIAEYQKSFPNSKILLVDGEAFSWYGSRIYKSEAYFEAFLSSLT